MFTWICPKCGGEVPPSYNECPRCSGQTASPAPAQPAAPPTPAPPPAATVPPAPAPAPSTPPPEAARTLSPVVVAAGATVLIAALLAALYFFVLPRRRADVLATQTTKMEPAAAPQSRHPLAKHLEVAGVRIVESASGVAKIQFLVINHSAADLPEMKMDVTLRAADREIFAFPVSLPSIGPYESKDLTATVKTNLKPYELPDWQLIRAEFRLASEP